MSFDSALSGLNASSTNLSVIGNNIANASTTGFKSARSEFTDVYAASALGVSSSSAGTGVKVSGITQEFTNGDISSTNRSLDMAIKGTGFFVLNNQGSQIYSTNGAFDLDKSGYIVNSSLARLNGFLTDGNGNITGAIGDLQISNANIPPKATTQVQIGVNLDSNSAVKTQPFVTGFTPTTPPDPTTFNSEAQTVINDSLGNQHIMTTYYCKTPAPNTWRVYVGIDGTDVTPGSSAPPAGPYPQPYANTSIAQPFTMVFTSNGKFIPHNAAAPTQFYGPGPVVGNDGSLTNAGSLVPTQLADLVINGKSITAPTPTYDVLSTSDGLASSISIASSINASSSIHGVTAFINPNNLDLGTFTAGGTGVLTTGMLTINGIQINGNIGATPGTQLANLAALINTTTPQTGVSAQAAGTDLILTSLDGRNIQLQTNGSSGGPTFSNLNMVGGTPLNKVKSGAITLSTTPKLNNNALNNYVPGTGTLAGNNLQINGTPIIGTAANTKALVNLINAQSAVTSVTAIQVGDSITLESSGGNSINVSSDGAVPAGGPTFGNFAMLGGGTPVSQNQAGIAALEQQDNDPITISGNSPLIAGFAAGTLCGIVQTSSDALTIPNWNPGTGATSPNPINIDLSATTEYRADFAVLSLTQDGYATGGVAGLGVDRTGIITAQYTNGQSQTLGQVALASFPATNYLQPLGDTSWTETYASGAALIGTPATASLGLILAGSLEDSNVDITSELVNLIIAQRNFQANAQTIKTEDAVTQTIINLR